MTSAGAVDEYAAYSMAGFSKLNAVGSVAASRKTTFMGFPRLEIVGGSNRA
jgi:hypothetical protein